MFCINKTQKKKEGTHLEPKWCVQHHDHLGPFPFPSTTLFFAALDGVEVFVDAIFVGQHIKYCYIIISTNLVEYINNIKRKKIPLTARDTLVLRPCTLSLVTAVDTSTAMAQQLFGVSRWSGGRLVVNGGGHLLLLLLL